MDGKRLRDINECVIFPSASVSSVKVSSRVLAIRLQSHLVRDIIHNSFLTADEPQAGILELFIYR